MTRKDGPIDPLYDFDNQSIEIDVLTLIHIFLMKTSNSSKHIYFQKTKDHIRINTLMKGKPLIEYRLADVRTLFDVLPKGLEVSGNGPCMGEREVILKQTFWLKKSRGFR